MKQQITIQLNDVEIELDSQFLEFYKKETGHSVVTKRGVTRFLQRLFDLFGMDEITEHCSSPTYSVPIVHPK
jgi:hypothetical protein